MVDDLVEIGRIQMRQPSGEQSVITVSRRGTRGAVHLHLSRTDEGEALLVLPWFAAERLADLMAEATDDRTT